MTDTGIYLLGTHSEDWQKNEYFILFYMSATPQYYATDYNILPCLVILMTHI